MTVDLWSVVGKSKLIYWGKFKLSRVVFVTCTGYLSRWENIFIRMHFCSQNILMPWFDINWISLRKKSLFVIKRMPIEIWRGGDVMAVAECSFMMYQAHILCLLDLAVQYSPKSNFIKAKTFVWRANRKYVNCALAADSKRLLFQQRDRKKIAW